MPTISRTAFVSAALVGAAIIIIALALRPLEVTVSAPGSAPGLTVSGTAVRHLSPDEAIINLGVSATRQTVAQARQEAAGRAEQIVAAFHRLGLADSDIRTTSVNLSPVWSPNNCVYPLPVEQLVPVPEVNKGSAGAATGESPGTPVVLPPCGSPGQPVGYTFSESFEVTVHDLDQAGEVIDRGTAAGASSVDGIRFDIADRASIQNELRAEAVHDARARAKILASAAGTRLAGVLAISESPTGDPIFYAGNLAKRDAGTPIEPGSFDLSLSVSVSFALED